ncbi:MAG: WG repeat-containing protein [Fibrobacteria bacterium]
MNRLFLSVCASACVFGLWFPLLWPTQPRNPLRPSFQQTTRISAAMAAVEKPPVAPTSPLPDCRFEWAGDFAQGLAPVRMEGLFGYIDTSGKPVIPPRYDFAGGFSENRAACLRDGKWGYLDVTGREVIPPAYSSAGPFSEGLALVSAGENFSFIDTLGAALGLLRFTDARPFSQGMAAVRMEYDGGDAWGFIDKQGALAVPLLFPDVPGGFSEGLAVVRVESEMPYRSGFIDSSGGFAIDTLYDAASDFHEGLAAVGQGQWRGNRFQGLWGYVDRSGKLVITPHFSEAGEFRHGKAMVRNQNGGYAWIDKQGRVTGTFRPDLRVCRPKQDDIVTYQVRETFGFLDSRGHGLCPVRFADAGLFREGRARVRLITVGAPIWAYIEEHGRYLGGESKAAPEPLR